MNQSYKLRKKIKSSTSSYHLDALGLTDCGLAYGLCAELVVLVGWGVDKRWGRVSALRRLGKSPGTGNVTDTKKNLTVHLIL